MSSIILVVVFAFELIFATYCILTRLYHESMRSMIRICALATYTTLMAFSIATWSFRWYALSSILVALATMGAINLMRKKSNDKAFRSGKVIGRAIGCTLIVLFSISPALIFPQYEPLETTGVYGVETVVYTYADGNRIETYSNTGEHRKITVQYWYPEVTEGKYPFVIFSHGSFGTRSSNLSLYRELASHGYVVCSIDHTYQCLYTTDTEGKTTLLDSSYRREIFAEDAKSNKKQSYEYYQKWMKIRTDDINLVIDTALCKAVNNSSDLVYKLIEPAKIGVMGHSLGGAAALGIGRIRDDVDLVMALESPFMCDIVGVENGEFIWNEEDYPVPVLNIYSDSSWDHLDEWPQYKANAELLESTETIAHNICIRGAEHLTLTDLALSSPFLTRMLNGHKASINTIYCLTTLNRLTLDFFDCYLKGKGKFTPQKFY